MKTTFEGVREMTKNLWEAASQDEWPEGLAVLTDFGLIHFSYDENPSSKHLGAIQHCILHDLITPTELDAASGSGPALTKLTQRQQFYVVQFRTPYDDMTSQER